MARAFVGREMHLRPSDDADERCDAMRRSNGEVIIVTQTTPRRVSLVRLEPIANYPI
jgi:hypothetical protein